MKVLVTGGKGFIGTKLVARLRAENHEVSTFDLADKQDLRNYGSIERAVEGMDAVFHLAAIADLNQSRVHPMETMEVNVKGTWNVAHACWQHQAKLFYASTCCVYGNQEHHPVTELTLPAPAEMYACSKLSGEHAIEGYHHTYGLQYNHMRFATIYGEGTRSALGTHIFLGQALRGEPITVHGDGLQTRTLTHVDDLIDAIATLFNSGKMNGAWNLTTEEEVSALQMASDIKKLTKSSSEIVFLPQRVGQTMRESVSAKKMLSETGWKAQVPWIEGITRMRWWFVSTGQIENLYRMPK